MELDELIICIVAVVNVRLSSIHHHTKGHFVALTPAEY